MKCNTEPSADVFISNSTSSFESSDLKRLNSQPFIPSTVSFENSDLKRLNSQPFIPKFRTKQNSNQYFYREFNEEDEYEE